MGTVNQGVAIPLADRARSYFQNLQGTICTALEELDGKGKFTDDQWQRPEGGGGLTRVMAEGNVFEKAGVNCSTVFGLMPEALARRMDITPATFMATGISLVFHPMSPLLPTVHANLRYFETENGDAWFGGGADLTPYYPYDEDIIHFHTTLKQASDSHDASFYPEFKHWCDEYFYIRHRREARGVGGIFFDYLRGDHEKHFAFVRSVGDSFLDAYLPIVKRRMNEQWGERERRWQLIRRGRYVEFNLVYDRGTAFGLGTNGRTESILMSLPPYASWPYDYKPEPNSREGRLIDLLAHPKKWIV